MAQRKIIVVDDARALSARAAKEIARLAGEACAAPGGFRICLTGGSTPAPVYELLAGPFKSAIDWRRVDFFWGDERCVPPDNEASNFGMANRTMLSKLHLSPEQIHRIKGERDPQAGALEYEAELKRCFALRDGEFPSFDLVLLGLGSNAHTLSLFPGAPQVRERKRLVVAVEAEAAVRWRVSLTAPTVNAARILMFMVCGAAKAQAVKNVMEGPRDPDRFPAQLIEPASGGLVWLLDKAAAHLLSSA